MLGVPIRQIFTRQINRKSIIHQPIVNLNFINEITKDKVAILDLDKTLWNFYSGFEDMHDNVVNSESPVYPQARELIDNLKHDHHLAIASLSPDTTYALRCVEELFGLETFDRIVIRGLYNKEFCKVNGLEYDPFEQYLTKHYHFGQIKRTFGLDPTKYTLYDDDQRNIDIALNLGMSAVLWKID